MYLVLASSSTGPASGQGAIQSFSGYESIKPILMLIGVVVPSLTSVTVEVVTVAGSIGSENSAAISVLRSTPVAPSAGYTSLTMGPILGAGMSLLMARL